MRHQRLECGKEPQFSCRFCEYRAKQKSKLKYHLYCKHGQILETNCKTFLMTHCYLPVLTPDVEHECVQCGRKYNRKHNLNRHVRLECGKSPQFSCQFCPYKAKQKSNLQSHIAIKHGDNLRQA
ncbi:zinc finger X-chromosomal protein-like [Homalodisca vitripennis]|uniref:zinc finger X-chromosomal protein-like n=1 Tax=Homalodisca vitripennis TaxID=197043 RepID=UPI001EEA888E|nr:zinc finger X-chromosomal protein-like [Homalodisca vitripennis]